VSDSQAEPIFSLPVRVYYEDTDSGGVVYYANYLRFMERARAEWLRSLGFEQDVLQRHEGLVFAVQRAEIQYLRPAIFNDLLAVTAKLCARGAASMVFEHEVRRESDATICCRGRIKLACLSDRTLRPKRMSDELLAEIANVL